MKGIRILIRIDNRFTGDTVTFGSPLSQINEFAAFTTERFPFLIVLPGNGFSTLWTINFCHHSYIAQQLSLKETGSRACWGR